LVYLETGPIAKCDIRDREDREKLAGIFEATFCFESIQMATATKSTPYLKTLCLFDMEYSRTGVGNLEAIIVVLVLIDVVICDIGNSDIESEQIRAGTRNFPRRNSQREDNDKNSDAERNQVSPPEPLHV
jgi:hypothetical protein